MPRCWRSTIRSSTLIAARRAFSGLAKAAMTRRARRTSSGVGAKEVFAGSTWLGWISVLPSKPRSRACRHSTRQPSTSAMSFHTPSRMVRPSARAAASTIMIQGSIGARPGTICARVLGEIIGAEHEAGQARAPVAPRPGDRRDVEDRGRRLDHRPDVDALGRIKRFEVVGDALQHRRRGHLRHQDGIGPRPDGGAQVGIAPRRLRRVHPDDELAAAVIAIRDGAAHLLARQLLLLGGDGILEVEDQRVGGKRARLVEGATVGAGHEENATAQAHGAQGRDPFCGWQEGRSSPPRDDAQRWRTTIGRHVPTPKARPKAIFDEIVRRISEMSRMKPQFRCF